MEITVNTNFADSIVQIVNDLCAKFGIALDWTAANVWPKVQELMGKFIDYKIAVSWLGIIAPLVIFLFFIILFNIGKKKDWDEDLCIFICVLAIFAGIIFVIFAIINIFSIIRCYNFPELEIYKYFEHQGIFNK